MRKNSDYVTAKFMKPIKNANLDSDTDFRAIIKASEQYISDKDLARALRVSRPTVSRWRSGATTPVPFARKMVYDFLLFYLNNCRGKE